MYIFFVFLLLLPPIFILIMSFYLSLRESDFRCFFDGGRQKPLLIFSRGLKPLRRKNPKAMIFFGIFPEDVFAFCAYIFSLYFLMLFGFLARRRLPDERPKQYHFLGAGDSTVW